MKTSRLFISMPVVLRNFDVLKAAFSPVMRGRWSSENQLHATLLFLGERLDETEVLKRLEHFTCKLPASLKLTALSLLERRILYAGVEGDLQEIHEDLCRLFELPPKALLLHVTLMRVKEMTDAVNGALLLETLKPEGCVLPHIDLMRSELFPDGARYTRVRRIVL